MVVSCHILFSALFYDCPTIHMFYEMLCLFLARQPPVGQGLIILEVSRSLSMTHHSRLDSSGRVIGSSQRPLPDKTQHSQQTDIHAPRWDSYPQSQQLGPQTYVFDRAATGTGCMRCFFSLSLSWRNSPQ